MHSLVNTENLLPGTIANSEETQVKCGILLQYAAFHQGLHSLKIQKGTRNHVFETLSAHMDGALY